VPMVLLQSLGQSFTLFAAIIILLANSDPTRATAIAAYIQVVRLGGAEIGISLMATWLRVREQIHSNLLGLHVETGGFDVTHRLAKMTDYFASHGAGTAPARAAATLAALVQRESNVLAYIDGFWLTVWVAIAGLALTACIGVAPSGPFTPKKSSG
jgi:DHA2 family multidrug resistance protein